MNTQTDGNTPRWFLFVQNNSGGDFHVDASAGIGVSVFVQAHNAVEANERATAIGIYFNGVNNGLDCPCCGDRWCEAELRDPPELYSANGNRRFPVVPCAPAEPSRWEDPIYMHPLEGCFYQARMDR